MNNHSKEIRSYNMSQIKSKNSKPEESATKYLFSKGFRYRKNVDTLPGSPDIVFAKYKTVVFVNGCFWHMHEGYWTKKLMRNKARDEENKEALEKLGWKVLTVWECELKKSLIEERLNLLCRQITE